MLNTIIITYFHLQIICGIKKHWKVGETPNKLVGPLYHHLPETLSIFVSNLKEFVIEKFKNS